MGSLHYHHHENTTKRRQTSCPPCTVKTITVVVMQVNNKWFDIFSSMLIWLSLCLQYTRSRWIKLALVKYSTCTPAGEAVSYNDGRASPELQIVSFSMAAKAFPTKHKDSTESIICKALYQHQLACQC